MHTQYIAFINISNFVSLLFHTHAYGYSPRHIIVIVIGLLASNRGQSISCSQVFIQYNHVSHLPLQVVVNVKPPLPRLVEGLHMDTSTSNNSRQHSNSLVLSRGDNPRDKSGLLDVKKGVDSALLDGCNLTG